MARDPNKGKPVEEDDYSDIDSDEEEEEWRWKMIAYTKKRVLEFCLKEKPSKEEDAVLKDALTVYVERMKSGMYVRHSKNFKRCVEYYHVKSC